MYAYVSILGPYGERNRLIAAKLLQKQAHGVLRGALQVRDDRIDVQVRGDAPGAVGGGGHAGTEVLPQQPSMAGQPAGSEGAYGGAANSTSYFSQPPGAAAARAARPPAAQLQG